MSRFKTGYWESHHSQSYVVSWIDVVLDYYLICWTAQHKACFNNWQIYLKETLLLQWEKRRSKNITSIPTFFKTMTRAVSKNLRNWLSHPIYECSFTFIIYMTRSMLFAPFFFQNFPFYNFCLDQQSTIFRKGSFKCLFISRPKSGPRTRVH